MTVLSSDAVTRDCPSPEKSTLLTVAVWALNTVLSPFLQIIGAKTMSAFIYLHVPVAALIYWYQTSSYKMFPNSNETTSLM